MPTMDRSVRGFTVIQGRRRKKKTKKNELHFFCLFFSLADIVVKTTSLNLVQEVNNFLHISNMRPARRLLRKHFNYFVHNKLNSNGTRSGANSRDLAGSDSMNCPAVSGNQPEQPAGRGRTRFAQPRPARTRSPAEDRCPSDVDRARVQAGWTN